MRKFIFILTTYIFSFIHISAINITNDITDKYEIRASWLTTIGGLDWPRTKATSPSTIKKQKEELCKQLDILQKANFNTVFFQTRLRGDVIYPSVYETFAESLAGATGKNPGYDVLKFAIDECHKRGMEIHAWIVTIPIGNKRQVRLLGNKSVVHKKPQLCKLVNGNWYLDPGNPETAEYLSLIINEIVKNYDIDGIHLDYIRYPERCDNFPDKATYKKYGNNKNIEEWRRDNITRIVREIYQNVKSVKPWVKVSSSPVGKYNDTKRYSSKGWNAYKTVYQDAQAWLKDGIHDAIFPMMYFKGNHFYPFALDWQENKQDRWVVPGLGIYFLSPEEGNWPLEEVSRQIYFSRKKGLDGQAYFRNQFLTENTKGLLENIRLNFYNRPAVIPPMKWLDSIPPAAPKNITVERDKEKTVLRWDSTGTYKNGGVYFRIYADNKLPIDTKTADNLICTRIENNSWEYLPKHPWDKKLYWCVTTVDRYGNESLPVYSNTSDISEKQSNYSNRGNLLSVCDALGNELFKTNEDYSNVISKLSNGVFIIYTTDRNGNKILLNTIVK